jgi:hypothetical protein
MDLLVGAGADPLAGSPSALETARFFGKEQLARQLMQHIQRRRSVNVERAATRTRGIGQTISRSARSLVQSRWAHEMRYSP